MKNIIKFLFVVMIIAVPALSYAKFTIEPIKVYIKPDEKLGSLTIKNETDKDVKFQAETTKWTRDDGVDNYVPSKDLIVTPKIFTIKAHSSQLVRIAPKANVKSVNDEKLYRVFLKEMPNGDDNSEGISTLFNFGIPVFLEPKINKAGELVCSVYNHEKDIDVECKNNHNEHVFISDVFIKNKGKVVDEFKFHTYLFSGEKSKQHFESDQKLDADSKATIVTYFKGNRIELDANVK